MIRTLLIDDENHCNQILKYELGQVWPDVHVVGMALSGEEGLSMIDKLKPDLIFLDIEMPGMSGFEMLQQLDMRDTAIIFVTAYSRYALQAFRFAALDYLLKPVVSEQLLEAVTRVRGRTIPQHRQIEVLLHNFKKDLQAPRIALPSGRGMDVVDVMEILYCKAESNYTHLYLRDNSSYTIARTLKDVEDLIGYYQFFRVHQSYLINFHFVKRYIRDDGGYVLMQNQIKIPISKRKKEEFLRLLRAR